MKTAVVSYQVDFRKRGGGGQQQESAPAGRTPRVAVLLALAHNVERKIRDGEFRDYAHAAEVLGMRQPRVSKNLYPRLRQIKRFYTLPGKMGQ